MFFINRSLLLAAIITVILTPMVNAQDQGQSNQNLAGDGAPRGNVTRNLIDERIRNQRNRIRSAVQAGTLTKEKAQSLTSSLDDLQARITSQRAKNGGNLKTEQRTETINALNQSNDVIKTYEKAGTSVANKGKVLGPTWTPGKDGAQNSKSLLQQMKAQSRMEQRQYKQAMEQKIEQQQLNYEKGQLRQFQNQRNDILDQKTNLQKERDATGSN